MKGAESITGGSWTMPIESVTEATTRSMTRNGREEQRADLKAGFQLGQNVGRDQNLKSQVGGVSRRGRFGDFDE